MSTARTVFKNTLFVTFGSLALKVVNFLFGIYVIRRLGDDRFGQYSIVLAFVGLFQILAELGISQYAMREIAQDRQKTEGMFWNVAAVRFLLGLLALGYIPLAARIFNYAPELLWGVMIYTSTFLLAALEAPLQMALTAHERFEYATGMTVLGQIAFTAFGAIFLFSGGNFVWLIVASLLSFIPKIAVGLWAVWRHGIIGFRPTFTPRSWPGLIRSGLPFSIIALTLTIAFSIDALMIKMFHTDAMVAWYRAPYELVFSILFITRGFKEAMVPSLARTYVEDPAQVTRWYYRTIKVMLLISLPIAVGGMMVAYPLIRFMLTPDYYPHSAIALQILIWDVPFLMYASFCGNLTTVVKEERAAAWIYTINAIANVVLNAIFIPLYGYVAASVITVFTDAIGAYQFHRLFQRKLATSTTEKKILSALLSVILRTAAAAAVMGVALWLARELHIFLLIPLGGAVYAVAALVFRLLDEEEWALIRKLLRKLKLLPQSA